MCLHAARLPGRVDASGELHTLFEQDRLRWDADLIAEGQRLLDLVGNRVRADRVSCRSCDRICPRTRTVCAEETDWERIVSLYDTLSAIRPSPVVALNRAIAIAQHQGPERGLEAVRADRRIGSARGLSVLSRDAG